MQKYDYNRVMLIKYNLLCCWVYVVELNTHHMQVHSNSLVKVRIFRNCEKSLFSRVHKEIKIKIRCQHLPIRLAYIKREWWHHCWKDVGKGHFHIVLESVYNNTAFLENLKKKLLNKSTFDFSFLLLTVFLER